MNRRQMIAGCALLAAGGTLRADHPLAIRFADFRGPGRKNLVDPEWAEATIALLKAEPEHIVCNSSVSIHRTRCDGCYLLPEHANTVCFPKGDEKNDWVWYGDASLVRDVWTKDGKSSGPEYYFCLGDNGIKLREAGPSDYHTAYPEEWGIR